MVQAMPPYLQHAFFSFRSPDSSLAFRPLDFVADFDDLASCILASIKCCAMVKKASSTLVPAFALVSKKGTPSLAAHCWPSSALTTLSVRSHLLPINSFLHNPWLAYRFTSFSQSCTCS